MKKKSAFLNFIKRFVLGVVVLITLIYGVVYLGHKVFFKIPFSDKPTIAALNQDGFSLDAASHEQPQTMEAYVEVLSRQVKNYNKHLDAYWPNNPQKNQYVIAKSLNEQEAYLIAPDGVIKRMSKPEFDSYNVSSFNMDGQWCPFNINDIEGAYIPVSPEGLKNYYVFQKYYHLGTYDQFLSYSHELFHSITQERWAGPTGIAYGNADRDERFNDSSARRTRMLLQQQLTAAICDGSNREKYIKEAVSTYKAYRKNNKTDYDAALPFDRIEGTAYYYELVSALYAGYPDQIKNQNDMYKALKVILADDRPAYRTIGVVSEGYKVGGFASILLDLLAIENNEDPMEWKKDIEKDYYLTPMLILEKKYENQLLPEPKSIPTQTEYDRWIAGKYEIAPEASLTSRIFTILYGIIF